MSLSPTRSLATGRDPGPRYSSVAVLLVALALFVTFVVALVAVSYPLTTLAVAGVAVGAVVAGRGLRRLCRRRATRLEVCLPRVDVCVSL